MRTEKHPNTPSQEMQEKNVMIGFLAWESTSVKTWETLWLRGSTGSVTGNYRDRRQQRTELRSNDIV